MKQWTRFMALAAALLGCLVSCADRDVVATIGNERITIRQLDALSQKKATLLGVESLTRAQRRELLDAMIQREIVVLHGRTRGVAVSREEIDARGADLDEKTRIQNLADIEKNIMVEKVRAAVTENVTATWDDLDRYYRSHQEDFLRPVRYKVLLVPGQPPELPHVLERARERPGHFEDMALNLVPADVRALNANAPYAPLDDFPEEMQQVLARMAIGDIEGPVTTARGTFLFELVDRKPEGVVSFREAYDDVRHLVLAEKRQEAFDAWYRETRKAYPVVIHEERI